MCPWFDSRWHHKKEETQHVSSFLWCHLWRLFLFRFAKGRPPADILLTLHPENTYFMNHIGQIISLIVAVLWTVTAIYSDKASHRIGVMSANVARLTLSTFLLALFLWVTIGYPILFMPMHEPGSGWRYRP